MYGRKLTVEKGMVLALCKPGCRLAWTWGGGERNGRSIFVVLVDRITPCTVDMYGGDLKVESGPLLNPVSRDLECRRTWGEKERNRIKRWKTSSENVDIDKLERRLVVKPCFPLGTRRRVIRIMVAQKINRWHL
jgi:hypothetical protein